MKLCKSRIQKVNSAEEIPDLQALNTAKQYKQQGIHERDLANILSPTLLDLWWIDEKAGLPVGTNAYFNYNYTDGVRDYSPQIEISESFLPIGAELTLDEEYQKRFRGEMNQRDIQKAFHGHKAYNRGKTIKGYDKNLTDAYINPLSLHTIMTSKDDLWRLDNSCVARNRGDERQDKHTLASVIAGVQRTLRKTVEDAGKSYHRHLGFNTRSKFESTYNAWLPIILQYRFIHEESIPQCYASYQTDTTHSLNIQFANTIANDTKHTGLILDPEDICLPLTSKKNRTDAAIKQRAWYTRLLGTTGGFQYREPYDFAPRIHGHARTTDIQDMRGVHLEGNAYTGKMFAINPRYLDSYIIDTNPYTLICKIAAQLAVTLSSYYNITYGIAVKLATATEITTPIFELPLERNRSLYLFPRILSSIACDVLNNAINENMNIYSAILYEKADESTT